MATNQTRGARVVGVGAVCELAERSRSRFTCDITEVVDLASGETIAIREDRGFSVSLDPADPADPADPDDTLSERQVREHAAMALLPDEGIPEDAGEPLPWHEYVELLAPRGLSTSASHLRSVPFALVLGPSLRAALGDRG